MLPCRLDSQITFLYFKDLAEAAFFFEDILQLELVDNQGAAKIYRLCGNAFIAHLISSTTWPTLRVR